MLTSGFYGSVGDREECEDEIKERSKGRNDDDGPEDTKAPSMGAKSLCIPFEQPAGEHAIVPGTTKCTQCGKNAKACTIFFTSLYNLLVVYILIA